LTIFNPIQKRQSMEEIRVPLLNANEDEIDVVEVLVDEGSAVRAGDTICVVESTKATYDVEAPMVGFVRLLQIREGERVKVGALICLLTETADEVVALPDENVAALRVSARATRKAAALAAEHGIDLSAIPVSGIIKERDVQAVIDKLKEKTSETPTNSLAPTHKVSVMSQAGEAVVVYGAGGHARVLIDLIREGRRDLHVVAAVDDSPQRVECVLGVPVVGDVSRLAELRARGIRYAVLGVGSVTNNAARIPLFERLRHEGFTIPNLIHPKAAVEPSVRMGQGNQILAGAVISSTVELGDNTIINSNVVVSHDCRIASHTHLTPGVMFAGGVSVEESSVIGMGVTVYLGVHIGRGVTVANGVHVMHDIADGAVVRSVRG
jgi:sugar O-acyltransferase (sialic acid O-acetyltransferase NeuD family)